MNVLIIGKDSYIGSHIKSFLEAQGHTVKEFDVLNARPEEKDLVGADSVIQVAAIVHRKDIDDYSVYKKVNVDLPVEVATLAKTCGVKQFVFLSTMSVYGMDKSLKGSVITADTPYAPVGHYGRSKAEAERALGALAGEDFRLAIVQPANVYGKGCRGNYITGFLKIAKRLPAVPYAYTNTRQGFLYIDNLCQLIRLIVENRAEGVFPAQDDPPVSSTELLLALANAAGFKRKPSKLLGFPFRILRFGPVKKLFGGVAYAKEFAQTELGDYTVVPFEEGIKATVAP